MTDSLKSTKLLKVKVLDMYVPGVVDQACTNLERVSCIVKKARELSMDFDVYSNLNQWLIKLMNVI